MLITIDPVTGVGTTIGPVSTLGLQALALDPDSRMLYATECDGSGACPVTSLVRNDPASGARTLVGPIGFSIAGLAFDARARMLYGIDVASGEHLVRIDPRTGAGSLVGPAIHNCRGLAYDAQVRRLSGPIPSRPTCSSSISRAARARCSPAPPHACRASLARSTSASSATGGRRAGIDAVLPTLLRDGHGLAADRDEPRCSAG